MKYHQGRSARGLNCGSAKSAGTRNAWVLSVVGFLFAGFVLVSLALGRTPDPKEGMKVFWSKGCVRCHPVLGEGANNGPDLSRIPSAGDGLGFAAAMWSHGPQMWQRMSLEQVQLPKFEGEEMEDLFAFLTMVSSLDEPGNSAAGRLVFQTKRCVECHSIRGAGGKVGPDLAKVNSNLNPVGWIAAMWNHAPGMFRAMTEKGVPFPTFQGNEMADLQAYIRLTAGFPQEDRSYNRYIRPPNADEGETLFRVKQCIQCHSIAGYGGKVGPDLSRVELPRKYGAIALVLWNHAPQMQRMMATLSIALPQFEAQELADLLAYLSSLSMKQEGNAAAGAATFKSKGCSACHGTTARASSIGPNLTSTRENLTPIGIARVMWNHGPAMLQKMELSSISWPVFNNKELADTLAFLKSIQASSAPAYPAEAARSTP